MVPWLFIACLNSKKKYLFIYGELKNKLPSLLTVKPQVTFTRIIVKKKKARYFGNRAISVFVTYFSEQAFSIVWK